jgi:hypothetical protein
MKLNNKKGFIVGWDYIAGFFIYALLFVFMAGTYDFMLEEVYYPVNDVLNESLSTLDNYESNEGYIALNENRANIKNNVIPFNLLFIFMFFYMIIVSFQNVIKEKKQTPSNLVFKTIGGMIFLLFVIQKFLFVVIEWFNVEILNYLFESLIITYIPFYLTIMSSAGIIILLWGGGLVIANWFFGSDEVIR